MSALERTSLPLVLTERGSVRAERVVIAMNAWAAELRELSRSFVALGADAAATVPVPDRVAKLGWDSAIGVNDSRMLINFHRTTGDGRVVFGKGFADPIFRNRVGSRLDGLSSHAADLARNFGKLHPRLADVALDTTWSGPIDRTVDNLPFFCGLGGRPDIVCGLGWSGNGIGPSLLGGKILASLALGLDDEWSASPLVRQPPTFPGEPLRYVGAHVVRRAVRAKEQAEDEGRQPGRLTLTIAGLSPSGLVAEKGGVRRRS
jgi:glycine/D-amino acid oxidase-like deaminating enzyme